MRTGSRLPPPRSWCLTPALVALVACPQFEKELSRCVRLLEELDAAVARKKEVSQQVGRQGSGELDPV